MSELYWRKKDDLQLFVLVKSQVSGFHHYHHTTTVLPLDSHPITFQQTGQDLWTQHPYNISHLPESPELPAWHLVSNTLSNPQTETITVVATGQYTWIKRSHHALGSSQTTMTRKSLLAFFSQISHPFLPTAANSRAYIVPLCTSGNWVLHQRRYSNSVTTRVLYLIVITLSSLLLQW